MNINSYRLSILSVAEIDDLYSLPRFTEEDRHLYFDLSVAEREAVTAVHTLPAAVHLTLQLGYFKAKRQFFVYEWVRASGVAHFAHSIWPTWITLLCTN